MPDKKIIFPKEIITLLTLAVILNLARIVIFDSVYFVYILWNLFLALLPFLVSSILLSYHNENKLNTLFLAIGGIVWILLLPNAPYIVTDLMHIGRGHGAPVLYDVFLLFSSAWVGLLLGMHSIFHMEKIIRARYGNIIASIKIPSIILLTSIGVYIGRYLRFNSWDVFADRSFFGDTLDTLNQPVHLNEAALFIISCFFFLYMSYRAWKYSQNKPL